MTIPFKKTLFFVSALIFTGPMFCSCLPNNEEELQEVDIDKSLIVGSWVNNNNKNEHWLYESMNSSGTGTGVYWDTSEMSYNDAAEGPGLFQYYFNQTGLIRIYWMETTNSYSNPDTNSPFIIDVLNATTMTYHTSGTSHSYSFTRQ